MVRFRGIALGSLIWCLLVSSSLFAQSIQGSITGLVTDPNGAVVAGAQVVATEVATGVRHEETTNSGGLYTFQVLPRGTYVVTVSQTGFKETKSENIFLVAQAMNRFDAKLEMGSISEIMVVKANAATLITDSAEIGDLQVGEDIVKEPTQRSMRAVLSLSASNTFNGGFSIGGQRVEYNNLNIDGVTTLNNNFGGRSGAATDEQSFESIAEVKVVDAGGSAEYPGTASLLTTTKSGTNQLHGSAFYLTDNAALNALPFGTHPPGLKGPEFHHYGGSLGGPVFIPKVYDGHNKTFFFVTWDHRTFPLAAGNASLRAANLPTSAFRGQSNANGDADFSSLLTLPGGAIQLYDPFNGNVPFAGNIIPKARLSPVALAFQNNYYPASNQSGTAGFPYENNYQVLHTSPEHLDREDIKIDHHFSDRDTISGRFTTQDDPQPNNYDTNTLVFHHSRGTNITNTYLGETHIFSPTVVNEFRLGYSRDYRFFKPSHDGNAVLKLTGLNLAVTPHAGTGGFPEIDISGGVDGLNELSSVIFVSQEYSLLDNLSWQKGKHSIKTGILVRSGRPGLANGNFSNQFGKLGFSGFATSGGGASAGFGYADFLLGVPSSAHQDANFPNVNFRKVDTGAYVQDSWHATRKLTINAGLRWEYYMPPEDREDRRVNFDPATGNIVVGNAKTLSLFSPTNPTVLVTNAEISKSGYPGSSLISSRKTNFGPRLGFAYLLDKSMVVRGGYGIYFGQLIQAYQDRLENSGLFGTSLDAPPNAFTANAPLYGFPSPFASVQAGGGSGCTTACGINVGGTDPRLKTPTTQQWNLTVERDLGHSIVARVGYRAFMVTQLPVTDNLIVPRVNPGPQNYPFYGSVTWTHDGAIQKLNALDLTLERKFTNGLTFRSSYALSKNVSDVGGSGEGGTPSNPYNRSADMGNVMSTPRHRLVNNIVWDIPFGKGRRFGSDIAKPVDYILGGWETVFINVFQSGNFLTPSYTPASSPFDNGAGFRPNCNGSLSAAHQSRNMWFNTAAISAPTSSVYGNCGVGIIQGPGLIGFSFGLHKAFMLSEKVKLQYEANMMNVLNHPNPGDPDTNLNDGTFGQISPANFTGGYDLFNPSATSNNGERHIQMGLRVEF